jgi:light-regulated signal transduction histidine kinase (bacteriophytochrome)
MYTLAIMRDTTKEHEARETLMQSNAALLRANQDLEQFAYAASHDLQEPLRLIMLYSQLLHRRYDQSLSEDAKQLLGTITESATRITDLVRDLLSYTNAASLDGLEPPATDLNVILGEVRNTLQERLASTSTVLSSDSLPIVRVHRAHLLQLFQNLLSNSIKYRSPDRALAIHVSSSNRENGMMELLVRDNGIGISPEYHERVFGVFKRLHTRSIPGTGIGLAICKKIVEYYGGSIRVDGAEGEGCTFHLTLPLA